jgi:ribosomal protein S18 acetylase RimI-like enzyme
MWTPDNPALSGVEQSGGGLLVRPLIADDEPAASLLLDAELGGRAQVRLGQVQDVLALPGFAATREECLVGIATYAVGDVRAELAAVAVAATHRSRGIGGALVEAVASTVARQGVRELWLTTTNDNLDALRLYQRHGFHLAELHAGAIQRARERKPGIPQQRAY